MLASSGCTLTQVKMPACMAINVSSGSMRLRFGTDVYRFIFAAILNGPDTPAQVRVRDLVKIVVD